MKQWPYLAVFVAFGVPPDWFDRLLPYVVVLLVVLAGVTVGVVFILIDSFYARKQGGTGQMKPILLRILSLSVSFSVLILGFWFSEMTLLMLDDSGIDQVLIFIISIIALVPFIAVSWILMNFADSLWQPPKLSVIRIESFPKSNGPQIAGVISRLTGINGVDDLLKKLPVEFKVEAETSEDLKSQLQQLGCN